MALQKALAVGLLLGAGAGVGSALFVLVTPGEQRKETMLKELPEKNHLHRDEMTRNNELVLATLQRAAATQENVAWRKDWTGSGR